MSSDEWRTEIGGYDPRKFYTKATDSRGHRESINLKVSPAIARLLSEIVQSRAVPAYKTVGDVVRDAIVHRLHWLDEEGYTRGRRDGSVLAWLEMVDRRLEEEQQNLALLGELEKLRGTVKDLCAKGPRGVQRARQMLEEIAESAGSIPDPFWRGEAERVLREADAEVERHGG